MRIEFNIPGEHVKSAALLWADRRSSSALQRKWDFALDRGLRPLHFTHNCAQWNAAPAGQPRTTRIGRRARQFENDF